MKKAKAKQLRTLKKFLKKQKRKKKRGGAQTDVPNG